VVIYSCLKKYQVCIIICVIFLIYTLGSFGFYYERTLQGELNNHILAGEMFGTPSEVRAHGVEPLYHGKDQTGWDGQFYYYMANDIFAVKDTALYIDAPAYRYQRIGLSLYAATIAGLLGQEWVSPSLFFISYLALLVFAVWTGARLFSQLGVSPFLILLWGGSVGTQLTLFNALPDAAADAFLIIAISAIVGKKYVFSIMPFTLAALSREIYILFPSVLLLFCIINNFKTTVIAEKMYQSRLKIITQSLLSLHPYYLLLIPLAVLICWQLYLTFHFGSVPGTASSGILGYPFVAWSQYFLSGISTAESLSLIMFMLMLITSFIIATRALFINKGASPVWVGWLSFTIICIVAVYACFGPVVMMHYTGYLKAIGVLFLVYPILVKYAAIANLHRVISLGLVLIIVSMTNYHNWTERILPDQSSDEYSKMSQITENESIDCFDDYMAEIQLLNITLESNSLFANIFSRGPRLRVELVLKNTGDKAFISTQNAGSIHMSYQWLDIDGNVIQDGTRTAILDSVPPGGSENATVVTSIPQRTGQYFLKLSPVQEGCAWFYNKNPELSATTSFYVENK